MRPVMQRFFITLLAAGFLSATAIGGHSALAGMNRVVQVTLGKADTVTLDKPAADVLVANPAIADVGSLRSNRLYVVGRTIGDTNVLAFDEAGNQLADITVRVSADDEALRDSVSRFFPDENVEVKTVRGDVILSGRVSTPSVANQVRDLASRFAPQNRPVVDLMTVEGEQQVMLKVRVIEAQRNALREFAFGTDINGSKHLDWDGANGIGLRGLAPFATGNIVSGRLMTNLRALETQGLISTLAEPNLTAISGETAGFLAGGEYPVPTGRDRDGNVTLEFKQFGVSLNFTPTILSRDRISLLLSTEVSAKSDENSIRIEDVLIPGLTVRRAETTVQMGSGGTIMIAGLIKSDTLDALNGIPGARDVPILGDLFKSKSFTRNETELVILVTPYIVRPYAQASAVPAYDADGPQMMQEVGAPDAPYETRALPPVDVPALAPEAVAAPVKKAEAEVLPPPAPAKKAALAAAPKVAAKPSPQPARMGAVFVNNLRNTYGARVSAPAAGQRYGYIVD